MDTDKYLDNGGRWNYEKSICETRKDTREIGTGGPLFELVYGYEVDDEECTSNIKGEINKKTGRKEKQS